MNCPICNIPLAMSDKQGIEIDYCTKCRGIWLDRGELEKIIERSNQPYSPQPGTRPSEGIRSNDYYGKPHDDHDDHGSHGYDQYGRKKKKSLLGDLFDF